MTNIIIGFIYVNCAYLHFYFNELCTTFACLWSNRQRVQNIQRCTYWVSGLHVHSGLPAHLPFMRPDRHWPAQWGIGTDKTFVSFCPSLRVPDRLWTLVSSLYAACTSVSKLHNKLFARAKLCVCMCVQYITLLLEQENKVNGSDFGILRRQGCLRVSSYWVR